MAKAANACTFSLSSDEDDDAESRRSPISRKKQAIAGRHRGFPEESDKAAKVDVNVQDKGETQVKVSTPSFVLQSLSLDRILLSTSLLFTLFTNRPPPFSPTLHVFPDPLFCPRAVQSDELDYLVEGLSK